MIDAIVHWNFGKVERADPGQARCIDAELIRIGAPPVMRVDPACAAEIVLGGVGIELIEREGVLTRDEAKIILSRRDDDRSSHTAVRAIATARSRQTPAERDPKLYGAAVTGAFEFSLVFVHDDASR